MLYLMYPSILLIFMEQSQDGALRTSLTLLQSEGGKQNPYD